MERASSRAISRSDILRRGSATATSPRAPALPLGATATSTNVTLADSPLIVDIDGQVRAITDDRTTHLTDYSPEGARAARNTPDGFYVASTMPDAAFKAIRGTLPSLRVRRAALLSDGAARLVDRFRLVDWHELLDLLDADGPGELIRAELAETDAERATRRGKQHDDATAVRMTHT
jgi:hypothetical protein